MPAQGLKYHLIYSLATATLGCQQAGMWPLVSAVCEELKNAR
ncbi:hypothetical protein CSC12_1834 [Klebsiella michiganensis]|nr:hypothetical protein CSC12_1834 [Klebsiella michiganensis]